MLLARSQLQIQMPKVWIKTIFLTIAITSTLLVTGCASKPQINNPTRYAVAPDYYTVRSGDTLSGISMRYGLSYISVAEMNDIAAPYRIYVGQSIRLKKSGNNVNRPATQALTTAPQIQRQTINLPTQQPVSPPVVQTAPATTTAPVVTAQVPVIPAKSTSLRWVKPSNGPVIANFNVTNNIKGLRFGGNQGDPVFAAADGQVVYAADGLKEYGNLVLIKHIDGYITAYAHNSQMLVKSGQNVSAGQKIAEMGSSGTNSVMLEFQVRLDGKPINPANILPVS
ncbi:peptidoglycan DD-metalloendopeptidase family protein [Acinetobacter piscicola]|uniref:peptidoglycan DD-metalloendopeptidase family protein n=1 Tax=Acinetobacter piscicola TaxID=2006115 RepID=UPI000B7EB32A|nr:peptidoglycan DD-metalloendopeptidase family protein [Acinetobacter piscicola]